MSNIIKVAQVIIQSAPDYFMVRCGACGEDGLHYRTCNARDSAGSIYVGNFNQY